MSVYLNSAFVSRVNFAVALFLLGACSRELPARGLFAVGDPIEVIVFVQVGSTDSVNERIFREFCWPLYLELINNHRGPMKISFWPISSKSYGEKLFIEGEVRTGSLRDVDHRKMMRAFREGAKRFNSVRAGETSEFVDVLGAVAAAERQVGTVPRDIPALVIFVSDFAHRTGRGGFDLTPRVDGFEDLRVHVEKSMLPSLRTIERFRDAKIALLFADIGKLGVATGVKSSDVVGDQQRLMLFWRDTVFTEILGVRQVNDSSAISSVVDALFKGMGD